MASLWLVVLTAFVCDVVSRTEAVPGDHFVKITKLVFNSANSVRVQWNYWSVKSAKNSSDVPRTQIDVYQNTSKCGANAVIDTLDISGTGSVGTKEVIMWQQDSRYPVTACIRVMVDQAWQAWESTRISPSYHSPPYFIEQPKQPNDLMSRLISERSVYVKYGGSPPPRWTWVINGQKYELARSYKEQGTIRSGEQFTLDRHHNIRQDLEIWSEVSNQYGTARSQKILVKKPYFEPHDCKSMNLDYKVVVNYTAGTILSCSGVDHSYPEMLHTWRFCAGTHCRALSEAGRLSQCAAVNFDDRLLESSNGEKLVFTHAYPSDDGCYVCESEHRILMESCLSTINLDQMGHEFDFRPKLLAQIPSVVLRSDGSPEPNSVNVGEKKVLECSFQGRPSPTIVWRLDGQEIMPDARHTFSQHNMVLTITDTQRSDEGPYTCTATNTDGTDYGRFLLHVQEKPVIKALAPQSGPVGENLTLFCDVHPSVSTITWFKNEDQKITDTSSGFIISSDGHSLTIVNAQLNDSATYTCKTRNRYGAASASTTLVVYEMLEIWNVRGEKIPEISPGYQSHLVYCNVSSDPNLQLDIKWNISVIESYACKQSHVTSNFSDSPHLMTLSMKLECQVMVKCLARSGGLEACALWGPSQESVPCDEGGNWITNTYPDLPWTHDIRIQGSTDESKPWYEEHQYVIMGTVGVVVIILLASIVAIVRFQRKKARLSGSRLSSFGSGGPLIQYTRDNNLNLGFVNNTLYWNSFVGENIKNKLKEVEIPRKQLTLGEMIGRGQFGRVYKGTLEDKMYWNANGTKTVAIKTLKYKADESDMVDLFLREALMMKGFDHPHVLSLIGVTMDTDRSPLVVLPYMDRGDLRTYISSPDLDFRVLELLKMGVQVANGMAYLSAKNFIHRDLAARNCMVDKLGNVKVADFGLSRDLFNGEYYRTEDGKNPLPIRWMALESLDAKIFTTKSDVWSFGVLLWELVTRGATPYPGIENWAIARHIHQGGRMKQPLYCPNSVYALMTECWSEVPKLRPSFETLQARLEVVTASASTGITEAPGAPMGRRGTLDMDIRTAKVTKLRGQDDNLATLKEVP